MELIKPTKLQIGDIVFYELTAYGLPVWYFHEMCGKPTEPPTWDEAKVVLVGSTVLITLSNNRFEWEWPLPESCEDCHLRIKIANSEIKVTNRWRAILDEF